MTGDARGGKRREEPRGATLLARRSLACCLLPRAERAAQQGNTLPDVVWPAAAKRQPRASHGSEAATPRENGPRNVNKRHPAGQRLTKFTLALTNFWPWIGIFKKFCLTGDARPRFFYVSLRFARGAGAARTCEAMTVGCKPILQNFAHAALDESAVTGPRCAPARTCAD